jgi:hypothetical protein
MLSRIATPTRAMRILTWDLEWNPADLTLRLAGLYDGKHYRGFLQLDQFLRFVLRPCYSGAFFFAHYGGRFDGVFLLFALRQMSDRLSVQYMTAGSSAVVIKVSDGRHTWHFCDSQFLFKESLRVMGKSIGLEKLDCPFDAPLSQLREYNERDCTILYLVLDRAAKSMSDLGSALSYTIASTGMQLFRRRYLSGDIPTSSILNRDLRASGAYVASRVEPILPYSPRGSHWDINSSFPYSMLNPLPGRHIRTNFDLGEMCIAKVRVSVPHDTYLPPLPVKVSGAVYFPTGTWDGWYTTIDIARLYQSGGRVERVYEAHHFEPFRDFAAFVTDIYRLRQAVIGKDEFLSLWFKKLMNSVYGKTSERPDKQRLVMLRDGQSPACYHGGEHDSPDGPTCIEYAGFPGMYRVRDSREPEHGHLPIAIWTTSNSRAILLDYGEQAKRLAYWDTDGFFGEYAGSSSKSLGALKHEYDYTEGLFVRPKLYSVLKEDGSEVVKAKGFPRMTRPEFIGVAKGGSVETRLFAGIRTALVGDAPSEVYRRKGLYRICPICSAAVDDDGCWDHSERPVSAFKSRPKRDYQLESSRPWSYDELGGDWAPGSSPTRLPDML